VGKSNIGEEDPMNTGLLIARLILGGALAAHGAQKLFGWFGGRGIAGTAPFFDSLGFRPAKPFVLAAGVGELGGGALVALGLLGPIGPALIVATMLVAIYAAHWGKGFFAESNGVELPLTYTAAALVLAFTGPGRYALDHALGLDRKPPLTAGFALFVAVLVALASLLVRHPSSRAGASGPA
jgi:putative oxidoreductase